MASMTIRDVPDDTLKVFAQRAERAGQSLQRYMRLRLIDDAANPTTDEWLSSVRARVALTGGAGIDTDEIGRMIREDRDRS